uniref:Uncharacterized protein n=1 Tax=Glossina austeni TaxID=7395 RepID=A0A1A9V810_GLOAU
MDQKRKLDYGPLLARIGIFYGKRARNLSTTSLNQRTQATNQPTNQPTNRPTKQPNAPLLQTIAHRVRSNCCKMHSKKCLKHGIFGVYRASLPVASQQSTNQRQAKSAAIAYVFTV